MDASQLEVQASILPNVTCSHDGCQRILQQNSMRSDRFAASKRGSLACMHTCCTAKIQLLHRASVGPSYIVWPVDDDEELTTVPAIHVLAVVQCIALHCIALQRRMLCKTSAPARRCMASCAIEHGIPVTFSTACCHEPLEARYRMVGSSKALKLGGPSAA